MNLRSHAQFEFKASCGGAFFMFAVCVCEYMNVKSHTYKYEFKVTCTNLNLRLRAGVHFSCLLCVYVCT